MQNREMITLNIGNVIPNAGKDRSEKILSLWKEVNEYFGGYDLTVEEPYKGQPGKYRVSLRADQVIELMSSALEKQDSFNQYRDAHAHDAEVRIGASLSVVVEALNEKTAPYSIYHAASVFLQQLLLGMNLALPGACQLLATRFTGAHSHRFEAQDFDSMAFSDAQLSAAEHTWPEIQDLPFEQVWRWLESTGCSERDTAIATVNKVLIDLLKIAQQRYRYGARTAMLVANQLEMLLGTLDDEDMVRARERVALILGMPPESADCFKELYRLRQALYRGEHPVRRPVLVYHDADEEITLQLAQHNSGIEKALAVVIALLQDLIRSNAEGYSFSEQLQRRTL